MASNHFIVIVGCGRLGGLLANQLSSEGNRVVIVDRDESAFQTLSSQYSGFTVTGDAAEIAVLKRAHIDQADYLFAMTTRDNINIMVAQIGREIFEVPHVVARVYDPVREEIYSKLGIETISPTKLAATAFRQVIFAEQFQEA